MVRGGWLLPSITPGTLPARRSARAAPLPPAGRAVAFNSLTLAICLSPCFLKVKGRIAARSHSAAGLQGCGGCGRGGVLAPKAGNDKERRGFFWGLGGSRVSQLVISGV